MRIFIAENFVNQNNLIFAICLYLPLPCHIFIVLGYRSVTIATMLRRFLSNLVLVFLLGFSQLGAISHEISHFHHLAHGSQLPDKALPTSACDKCIGYSQVSGGMATSFSVVPVIASSYEILLFKNTHHDNPHLAPYSARAPPYFA